MRYQIEFKTDINDYEYELFEALRAALLSPRRAPLRFVKDWSRFGDLFFDSADQEAVDAALDAEDEVVRYDLVCTIDDPKHRCADLYFEEMDQRFGSSGGFSTEAEVEEYFALENLKAMFPGDAVCEVERAIVRDAHINKLAAEAEERDTLQRG